MTPTYRVSFLPEATAALREAASYIAEQDGRDRAAEWLRGMYESIERLEDMPGTFAQVQVRAGRVIRSKLAMERYRVYFVIDEPGRTVYVIDVVHTARETKLATYRDDLKGSPGKPLTRPDDTERGGLSGVRTAEWWWAPPCGDPSEGDSASCADV